MNTTSLVIMAAGLGSRYGGIKQLESVGPNSEIIMDYSIFDAIRAGFDKIVIIIREDIQDDFMKIIGNRLINSIDIPIHIVFQSLDNLPAGYRIPDGRTKPWGTAQAILSVKEYIDEPFLVINADDFYGKDSYVKSQVFLSNSILNLKKPKFCIVGYPLENTLSNNGSVTRGVCKYKDDGKLLSIEETFSIQQENDGIIGSDSCGNKRLLSPSDTVSMNMMGFTPAIFPMLEKKFVDFLDNLNNNNPTKSEFLIPVAINELLSENLIDVEIVKTSANWFGVTFKEDKKLVENSLHKLIQKGIYPEALWR
ncbi:MAG: nucleotidyltransferase family protein [Catonella sp.]|uniref:nucleotidyltransferase family protein n=1 Tax=Catonella sp. TaxID=2382125 RepID=UPI003FA01C7B